MMKLDSRLKIGKQVMSREVGGETVLLDLESGVYFGIDEVGSRIWAGLSAGCTLSDVVDQIVENYTVERLQAEHDVVAFVEKLLDSGLVEAAD